jgi:predicted nucleic acid-binding protein
MTDYVFDAEPLIAYLYGEPGADTVRERLQSVDDEAETAAMAHATATEIVYKVARLEAGGPNHTAPSASDLDAATHDLRVLRGFGVAVESPSWTTTARIKAAGGISLGDAYAAALAAESDATLVVGADPEFNDLPIDISLERIRENPG